MPSDIHTPAGVRECLRNAEQEMASAVSGMRSLDRCGHVERKAINEAIDDLRVAGDRVVTAHQRFTERTVQQVQRL